MRGVVWGAIAAAAIGGATLFAGCGEAEPECGLDTTATCPAGEACIYEDGRGVCAESCSANDPCSSGTCNDCLASGDCPTCHVCVAACR